MDSKKLNQALKRAYAVIESKGNIHILNTKELSRSDRELLTKNRWLQEIIKGWYLLVRPDVKQGESSAWYANFWDFLHIYLNEHYGDHYCLSAENSIDLHIGTTAIPNQIIVMTNRGSGKPIELPFDTSLLVYSSKEGIPEEKINIKGLWTMSLPLALCKVSPIFFTSQPENAEIALSLIQEPSELIHIILKYHFVRSAGRLIGAYNFLNQKKMAESIREAAAQVGITGFELNPFEKEKPTLSVMRSKSPHSARIELMWAQYRKIIIELFPSIPGIPKNKDQYLNTLEELHTQDAYHSLSIEGYQISRELIEKVENGMWNPDQLSDDNHSKNALAARGYYEAFLEVKKSIQRVFNGDLSGEVIQENLPLWYRKLFLPFVNAKLLNPEDLWGYRHHQVYIRNSRHTPLSKEHLLDAMETFYYCLSQESHPGVRAVLGHFIFVYIHPYMDGNGRIARFLMNTMFASGGYPWTILKVENRKQYFDTLEIASVNKNIQPFTEFILSSMKE